MMKKKYNLPKSFGTFKNIKGAKDFAKKFEAAKQGVVHCVQCHASLVIIGAKIGICKNPCCPNYGLLSVGKEGMTKIEGA